MKIIIRISATTKIKFLKLQKTFRVSRAYCDKLINTFVTLQQIKDCSLLNILKKKNPWILPQEEAIQCVNLQVS